MNNVIMREITLTDTYQPLATEQTVVSMTVNCLPTNAGNAIFKGDDGSDVPWLPGEWHTFYRVDLAAIEVKGTPGDKITLIGGTW